MNNIDRLEIKQLRILQALLIERNVSRVGNKIGLTQQAVSDQLRKLRDIFEDRLFLRKSNGLVPTPFAEELGKKVESLLNDFGQLLTPDSFDPALVETTFVIVATDYAQQIVLPGLLSKIRKLAPGLKLIIQDFDIDNFHEIMVESKANLAIAFPDSIPRSYPYITLFTDHHVCVASKSSSLVNRKLNLEEIAAHPQIIASPSRPNFRGAVDAWFEKGGFPRNVVISAPCFSLVPRYIEATDSIAFLPSRLVLSDKLTKLDLEVSPVGFDVIAAWHPRSEEDPLHNWITNLLKEEYQNN